jgi:hypothetical protein
MATPAYLSEPQIYSLSRLLQEIMEGHLRLPLFQRDFVWDNHQRLDLLNSVREGIPIGSVLVWRTATQKLESFQGIGPHRLPERPPVEGGLRSYLLDGTQRLTTLLGSIHPRSQESAPVEGERVIGRELSWKIYYDLEQRIFRIQEEEADAPSVWLPLWLTFDGMGLLRFQRKLEKLPDSERLVTAADELVSTIRDYKIPVLAVVTENLEQATRIFHRINSRGTPMGEFHMMQALTWREGFDLRERLTAAKARLKDEGWDEEPEEDLFLDACKAALDLGIFEEAVEELGQRLERDPRVVDDVVAAVLHAVQFLRRECGVYSARLLPSRYQLILLADALRVCPQPSEEVKRSLIRWFWLTTYGGAFRAVTGNKLRRIQQYLRDITTEGNSHALGPEERVPTYFTLPERFHFRSARSKALSIQLARLGPRDVSGHPIEEPLALLARHGADAVVPLFRGRLESANRILVRPQEAQAMRDLLMHPERCSQELLESHAILGEAVEALQRQDVESFLQKRQDTLGALDRAFIVEYILEELALYFSGLKDEAE